MKKTLLLLTLILSLNFGVNAQNSNHTLSGEQPLTFVSMGNGTFNKSVIYHNPLHGFMVDLAKQSDNINSQPIDFSINARGGLNPFFTLKGINGNIGIGTKNPESKLQLMNGNNGISFDANNSWEGIGFNRSAKNGQILNTTKSAWQLTARNDYFSLEGYNGANNNLLNVLKNGNIGIGTRNPDMKLTVKGNIHAEEVKIDLNVPAPDYVFKESYNLRSIEEVEKFIKKNSHLPEIPSAKEFERNGVMLAEMDMNLLKKIEELTLYTIQQEKEIHKLKEQNSQMKKQFKELKSLVKKLLESKK